MVAQGANTMQQPILFGGNPPPPPVHLGMEEMFQEAVAQVEAQYIYDDHNCLPLTGMPSMRGWGL